MNEYQKLNNELKKAGLVRDKQNPDLGSGIDKLVNSNISSKKYLDILLKYILLLEENEQEMVVRGLTEKGNVKAVIFLFQILKNRKNMSIHNLWAVTNALYRINDKDTLQEILKFSKDETLGFARKPLLFFLSRIKTLESKKILIESLNDLSVRDAAIESLGKFGDKTLLVVIESIEVRKGHNEVRAKEKALKRLMAV